jgi:hypothetical protein
MVPRKRLGLDSNLIISSVLFSTSVPGAVFRQAIHNAQILVSEATLDELVDILSREKFDPTSQSRIDSGYCSFWSALPKSFRLHSQCAPAEIQRTTSSSK